MKQILNTIFFVLTLVLFIGVGSSCSDESFYFRTENEQEASCPTIGFTIALDGATRAGELASNGFEAGEGLENYLDIPNKNFKIYFFESDTKDDNDNIINGTFIDSFKPFLLPTPEYYQTSGGAKTLYQFRGEVPVDLPLKFKIVVLFNWPKYPEEIVDAPEIDDSVIVDESDNSEVKYALIKGKSTIQDLCQHSFAQFEALSGGDQWLDESSNLIPFYGVRSYDLNNYTSDIEDGKIKGNIIIDLSKDNNNNSTPLPLLRAMAKIEVLLYNSLSTFESVTIDKVNPLGFCAPKDASDYDKYVGGYDYDKENLGYDYDKHFVRDVHLPGSKNNPNGEPLKLTRVATPGNAKYEKWIAYVPEYKNKGMSDDYCSIIVTLKRPYGISEEEWKSQDKERLIYFSPNGKEPENNDGYYDLWRNNIYRFNITEMDKSFACMVDVQPYSEVILNPDFGLERDRDGKIIVRDKDGTIKKVINVDGTLADVELVIGDMSYVTVAFDDVIDYREFYETKTDENGKPICTGKIIGRQDFLETGWNLYYNSDTMVSCYIYNNKEYDGKPTYSVFDAYSNLIELYVDCTESDDQLEGVGGEKVIWTDKNKDSILQGKEPYYKIYYKSYNDGLEALQTILVVFDSTVLDENTKNKVLTVVTEDGDVKLNKEHTEIRGQFVVEVKEVKGKEEILKYRFFDDGKSQIFYYDETDNQYDWDFYDADGWRYSGYDHKHGGYEDKSVYSRYDKWGNLIERDLKALVDESNTEVNTEEAFTIIKNETSEDGTMYILYRQKDSNGVWMENDSEEGTWVKTYSITSTGQKKVLI